MRNKILTIILALAMILCILPITAFAEEQRIAVIDSKGVLLKPDDSRIKVDLATNTLTIYGDDLTVSPDSTEKPSEIAIDPELCNLVIESEGTVNLKGYYTTPEEGTPYGELYIASFTLNKGDVIFDSTYRYIDALYCYEDFTITGGSISFSGEADREVIRCNNLTMRGGTINVDVPKSSEGIDVSYSGDGTGCFKMTGGTININIPDDNSPALYCSTFDMSGGKITAVSGFGINGTHTKITGGEIDSTALNGSAYGISDGEISNCVLTLKSNNGEAFYCGHFTDIDDEIEPIKIHDCKLSAIATGEESYGIISLPGLEFSNVELYASGEMGAIVCANEPKYYASFDERYHNLAGPFTFSDDMKLCGSNTFNDKAEELEQAVTMYESDLMYGSHIFNFRILSTDGTTPALTVVNNIYKITDGAEQSWTKGSGTNLSFTSNATFDKFKALLVDSKEVAKDNYTSKEGSTIIDLKAAFLETLNAGKHTLEIVSTNGSARTEFTIIDNTAPNPAVEPEEIVKTGDHSMLALATISALSATAFYTSLALRKSKDQID